MAFMQNSTISERAKATSSTFYITIMALIQSIILGFFLNKINWINMIERPDLLYLLKALVVFTIIMHTWHEYIIGAILYIWIIKFFDTLIPFLFAVSQIIIINSIDNKPNIFILGLICYTIVGIFAYANQRNRASKYHENNNVINNTKSFFIKTIIAGTILLIEFLLIIIFDYKYNELLFFILLNSFFILFIIYSSHIYNKCLYLK